MTEPKTAIFVPRDIVPTDEQIEIQTATQRVVLGAANAGAAKTTTLALRIGEALARKTSPERILALAFTSEACDVLRRRLIDVGIAMDEVSRIEIATVEDFSRSTLAKLEDGKLKRVEHVRQLRTYACTAIDQVEEHYVGKYEFIDLGKHNRAITQFLDVQLKLKARMALEADFQLDFDDGLEGAALAAGVPLTDFLTTLEYERIRLGNSDIPVFRGPFDATYDLARYLSQTPNGADIFSEHSVLVCDELHDMNEASFRVISALINRPKCFFTGVGDKNQVIYTQLGASDEFLKYRFKQSFPNLKTYPLTYTYRHGPHLAYATDALMNNDAKSTVPRHTEIKQSHYDMETNDCVIQVLEAIKEWKRDGYRFDDCAILMRDRHQSIALEIALREAGIRYKTPTMGGFMQREEVLFLRGMMAIALKDFAAVPSYEVRTAILEALEVFGEVNENAAMMRKVKYDMVKANPELIAGFFDLYLGGLTSTENRGTLARTIDYIRSVAAETRADIVLSEICKRMNVEAVAKRLYVRPYEVSVVSKSVEGFLAFAASTGLNLRDFWKLINSAEAFATHKREKDFVYLDCVANVKGKEFDHVIMPFLEVNEFPNPMFEADGEQNLFYVGITRTKRRLTLISPSDTSKRSAYIRKMNIGGTAPAAELAMSRNEGMQSDAAPSRTYLNAGYAHHIVVKSLGASWDSTRRKWWIPAGVDHKPFAPWLSR